MYIPLPVLIAIGLAFLALLALAARRRAASSRDLMRPPLPPSPGTASSAPIPPEVRALVARGRKLEAIKLLRETSGLGLKEAKDIVDRVS